ncbi:MAG TPA: hypothetical protein VKM55_22725 [Candidatus Lokiarchaeia archaeon]|nr:hypothetical protein [Candidatus Lokiarchaeia archaeon]
MIQKSPSAAKGLIFLSIEKEFGEFGLYRSNVSNLIQIVKNSLKNMLVDLGVKDVDSIVIRLVEEIVNNQSLLFMITI